MLRSYHFRGYTAIRFRAGRRRAALDIGQKVKNGKGDRLLFEDVRKGKG
jgi:hypothetical protein